MTTVSTHREMFALRRAPAHVNVPTEFMAPVVAPAPIVTGPAGPPVAALGDWSWARTDRLLIPVALLLAERSRPAGRHRQPARTADRIVGGRVIRHHRAPRGAR